MTMQLNEQADKFRKELEDWIPHAKQWQDYSIDAKGNRQYYGEKVERYITAILESMGLAVRESEFVVESH